MAFLAKIQDEEATFTVHQKTTVEVGGAINSIDETIDRSGPDAQEVMTGHVGDVPFTLTRVRKDGDSYLKYGIGPWQSVVTPVGRSAIDELKPSDLMVVGSATYKGQAALLLRNVRPIPNFLNGSDPLAAGAISSDITDLDAYVDPDGTPIDMELEISVDFRTGGGSGIKGTASMEFSRFGDPITIRPPTIRKTLVIAFSRPPQVVPNEEHAAAADAVAAAVRERELINGWHIVIQPLDEDTAETERIKATQALFDPSVVAYLGPTQSTNAVAAIKATCAAGVAQVTYNITYAGFTRPVPARENEPDGWYLGCKRNFFRVASSQDVESRAAAAWVKRRGIANVWILTDGSDIGAIQVAAFRREAARQKVSIKGTSTVMALTSDIPAIAGRIAKARPGLVYFAGDMNTGIVRLWHGVRRALPKLRMMGTSEILYHGTSGATIEDMAGTVFTTRWIDRNLRGAADDHFVALVNPVTVSLETAPYAFDAARVVLDAIDRATASGSTDLAAIRRAVFDQVAATTDFKSSVGLTWSFDDAGDTTPSGVGLDRLDEHGTIESLEILTVP